MVQLIPISLIIDMPRLNLLIMNLIQKWKIKSTASGWHLRYHDWPLCLLDNRVDIKSYWFCCICNYLSFIKIKVPYPDRCLNDIPPRIRPALSNGAASTPKTPFLTIQPLLKYLTIQSWNYIFSWWCSDSVIIKKNQITITLFYFSFVLQDWHCTLITWPTCRF